VSTFTTEEIRKAILRVLGHDRWNSNLSDEHIAEKVAATLREPPAPSSDEEE
jgi:hypothetical protein